MAEEKVFINPSEISNLPDFVTVNPKLTKETGAQYEIIRSSTHDGTMVFTKELLMSVLSPIVNRVSFFKPEEPTDMSKVRYEIGLIKLETDFREKVTLPCGEFPGQVEKTTLPVKMEVLNG